jgi:hypothetical protein
VGFALSPPASHNFRKLPPRGPRNSRTMPVFGHSSATTQTLEKSSLPEVRRFIRRFPRITYKQFGLVAGQTEGLAIRPHATCASDLTSGALLLTCDCLLAGLAWATLPRSKTWLEQLTSSLPVIQEFLESIHTSPAYCYRCASRSDSHRGYRIFDFTPQSSLNASSTLRTSFACADR